MPSRVKQITNAEFTALLNAQGLPTEQLTFKCPMCATLQNINDLIAAGARDPGGSRQVPGFLLHRPIHRRPVASQATGRPALRLDPGRLLAVASPRSSARGQGSPVLRHRLTRRSASARRQACSRGRVSLRFLRPDRTFIGLAGHCCLH